MSYILLNEDKNMANKLKLVKRLILLLTTTILIFLITQAYLSNYKNTTTNEDNFQTFHQDWFKLTPVFVPSPPSNDSLSYEIYENTNYLENTNYFYIHRKKVNPVDRQILIQPRGLCEEPPFLMIVVPSVHTHQDMRNLIRRTWGSEEWPCSNHTTNVKLLFLFGTHTHSEMEFIIKQEAEIFNDVLQGDFVDSYYNLTVKILVGLHWLVNNCEGTSYVLKADEDTFTNVPLLVNFLKQHRLSHSVIGHLHTQARVHRVGKWAVPKSIYPFHTYPNYMAGNTYIISGDSLDKIVGSAQYVPYLNMEDVFITGVLVRILKLRHVNVKGFTMWLADKPSIDDIIQQKIITGTKISVTYGDEIWKAINNNSIFLC